MWLTKLFVSRPPLVTVFLCLVLLAGLVAGSTLVIQQFPSADVPSVQVLLTYPGASTTEMRDAVVRPLEDQLAGTPNLADLQTSIEPGQASIVGVFTLDSDQNDDLVQIQGRVQNATHSLPNDIQAPQISLYNPSEAVVVSLMLRSHSLSTGDLSSLTINKVVPALEQVPGVSFVQTNGVVTPSIQVSVDPGKMASSGASITDLISTITNNNVRSPGGIVYSKNRETNLDVRGDIQDVPTVSNLLLAVSGAATSSTDPWQTQSRYLRVGDVADVTDTYETQRVFSYSGGTNAITLNIQKSADVSEVTTAKNIENALPELRSTYPDVEFSTVNMQSTYTQEQLVGVFRTLAEAVVFTGLVMLFFLRSWRNAIVVMIAIPTSLLVTLTAMHLAHFTLDTVSLLAMTLIIGILVDDSIVVLENVERHHVRGVGPVMAAIMGRSEIGLAAIVITLVDVVVFLPISFLPGAVGLFLREFGLVVTVATLTSLFVSFTLTPTLAGRWALLSTWKPWGIIDRFTRSFDRLRDGYADHMLTWGLRNGTAVVAISLLSFLFAIILLPLGLVGFEYIPPVDRGELYITLRFPSGTPIDVTRRGVLAAEHIVTQSADVKAETATAGAYLGQLSGFINDASVGQIDVFLRSRRGQSTAQWAASFQNDIAKAVGAAAVTAVPATSTTGGNGQPIDEIIAATTGSPAGVAAKVLDALRATPGAIDVTSSDSANSPQYEISFDRDRARVLNVSVGTAATAIEAAFAGDLATQFTGPDGLKDVLVTYPLSSQNSIEGVLAIPIRTTGGNIIHVGDIAKLTPQPAPPIILRINRKDVIYLGANVAPGYLLSNVQRDFAKRLAKLDLPSTISVTPQVGGNQSALSNTLQGMSIALMLSTVLVYLLMVALYNSYRTPFIIMFAVPVAAVGALGSLALTHQTLNLFSLIGTVLLIGLVTKNGILLVDFANARQREGLDRVAAIREAARERFRPIMMTTIAMIAGMLPLALALDPGAQAAMSLGTVVIGGLLSSLLLTLLLVPVVYGNLATRYVPIDEADYQSIQAH
jgi:HAE1 family hydrophobic/amphiphilic exporter-1